MTVIHPAEYDANNIVFAVGKTSKSSYEFLNSLDDSVDTSNLSAYFEEREAADMYYFTITNK